MAVSFRIPGNIKSQMLPFVLRPSATMNQRVSGMSGSGALNSACDPQYFTFRNPDKYMWSGQAQLNFCPSSYKTHFDKDLSYRLLYNKNASTNKSQISFNDLLKDVPGIQIREYLPDTRLDQSLNFMSDLIDTVTGLFSPTKDANVQGAKEKSPGTVNEDVGFWEKLWGTCCYVMEYLVGSVQPNFYSEAFKFQGNTHKNYKTGSNADLMNYILYFPYMIYYRLQTSVTTNIYEIPALPSNNVMYSSDGTGGWPYAGFGRLSQIPGIETLDKLGLFSNIGINWMPWWNAKEGTNTSSPPVEIKFNLFNDTAEAAMMNFIFVNTIVPNNKWIQYNIFQHSPHIYDIKLEGYGRYYACRAFFNVAAKGVLREPGDAWIDGLKPYINSNMDTSTFLANIKQNHLIKIPDIYEVSMNFESMMPDNFNNYLFQYSENNNIITDYYGHVYDPSALSKELGMLPNAIEKFGTDVKKVWNAGGKY